MKILRIVINKTSNVRKLFFLIRLFRLSSSMNSDSFATITSVSATTNWHSRDVPMNDITTMFNGTQMFRVIKNFICWKFVVTFKKKFKISKNQKNVISNFLFTKAMLKKPVAIVFLVA